MRILRGVLVIFLITLSAGLSVAGGPALGRPPRVVDANGRVLGSLGSDTVSDPELNVLRKQGPAIFGLQVRRDGISVTAADFYHAAPDCSDARYLPVGSELIRRSVQSRGIDTSSVVSVSFPGDPVQTLTIRAAEFSPPMTPADCIANGGMPFGTNQCCRSFGPAPLDVGPAQKVDVSAYVPPFTLR